MSQVFNQVLEGGTGFLEQPSPIDVPIQPNNQARVRMEKVLHILKISKHLAEIQDSVDEYIAVNALEKQFVDKTNG